MAKGDKSKPVASPDELVKTGKEVKIEPAEQELTDEGKRSPVVFETPC